MTQNDFGSITSLPLNNTLLIYKTENDILLNQIKLSTTYTNNAIILRTNTITIKTNNIIVPHINMKLMTKYNIPLITKTHIRLIH
jgi:gamma-glutamyl phosphate reductase